MSTSLLILVILVSPLFVATLFWKIKKKPIDVNKYAAWGLGLAFIFFAIGHFVLTDGMVAMFPPWVPHKITLVYLTGILELLVGIALFNSKHRVNGAKTAIILFIVFYPVNIYAALNSIGLGGHQLGPEYLLTRTPLQIILILWAYFLCMKKYK